MPKRSITYQQKPTTARLLQRGQAERILEITGHTTDINEALDEFENVKAAVSDLFDQNQALAILNRRMRLTLEYASKTMDIVERDAQMFITPKARKWIEQFREQYKNLDNAILHGTPGQARAVLTKKGGALSPSKGESSQ